MDTHAFSDLPDKFWMMLRLRCSLYELETVLEINGDALPESIVFHFAEPLE